MFFKMRRIAAVALPFVVGPLLFGMVSLSGGCGGGNTSVQPISVPLTAAAFVGRIYTSDVMATSGTSNIAGTIFLSASSDSRVAVTFRPNAIGSGGGPSTVMAFGVLNPTTSQFTADGGYADQGVTVSMHLSGTLPLSPAITGGNVAVQFTREGAAFGSYTGAFGATAFPSPSPSPSPLITTPPPISGATLAFSATSPDTNATTTNLYAPYVYSTIHVQNGRGMESLIQPSRTDVSRRVYVGVSDAINLVSANSTYPAAGTGNQVNYEEQDANGVVRKWTATSGAVIIDFDNDEIITYRIVGATMAPNPTQANGATGTFTLNAGATTTEVGGSGD